VRGVTATSICGLLGVLLFSTVKFMIAPFFLTAPLELTSRLTGALAARTRSIIYTGILPDRMGNEYEIIEYYQWHKAKESSFQPPRSAASTG
jgi:hypothetical protein